MQADTRFQTTAFGRVAVLHPAREGDQIVQCQLTDWTLANGQHPTMFALASALSTTTNNNNNTPTPTPTRVDPLVENIIVNMRDDRAIDLMERFPPVTDTLSTSTTGCATPLVGGEQVSFYNDVYFAQIRQRFHIPADVISEKNVFNWDLMKPSEGKGGDAMQFTPDRKWIVKELGSDHLTLLAITKEYTAHICTGDSLLVRFGLHFKRLSNDKNYVLMNSWLPGSSKKNSSSTTTTTTTTTTSTSKNGDEKDDAATTEPSYMDMFQEVYDLKGCADDKMMLRNGRRLEQVHNRCWMISHKCYPNEERIKYSLGKNYARTCAFPIDHKQKNIIMKKIHYDTEWLKKEGLMDYSLIVGIKKCPQYKVYAEDNNQFTRGDTFGNNGPQPYVVRKKEVCQNEVIGYYVGIIDFLQFYNCGKAVAHHIKCCDVKPLATVPPTEYGDRFHDYFRDKFQSKKYPLTMIEWNTTTTMEKKSSSDGASTGMSKGEE
jgi:hypothetical protein